MRINSKSQLQDYIKMSLGAPVINVEVTEDQMSLIIDDAVQKFTEYAYGTLEEVVVVQFNGMGDYDLPNDITNIIAISKGNTSNITNFASNFGAGFVPDMWSDQFHAGSLTGDIIPNIVAISSTKAVLDKFFGSELSHNFNHLRKKLRLLEDFFGAAVIHYQYEYIANESDDFVYNHEWIKEYTIAKTKFQWGNNTGKFDQTLVGGARINYADMKNEASQDIDRLHEQLLTKWSDPAPIMIG